MKQSTTKQTLQLYWQHVWRYPKYVIGLLIGIPLVVLFSQVLPPLILANVLNHLAKSSYQTHQIWTSFGPSLIAYVLLLLVGGTLGWRIIDFLGWHLEGNVERDMARRVYKHMLELGANFHANHFGGSLVSQNNKLLSSYIRFADTTQFQLLPLLSGLTFSTIILSRRAPLYAAMLLTFALLYMVSSFFVSRNVRKLSGKHAAAESEQTGYLADSVTNIMAIKSFSGGDFEKRQYQRATNLTHERLMGVMVGSQKQLIYFSGLGSTIQGLALVMAVVGVVILKTNLATVFLILTYTASITNQLLVFSNNSLRNYNRSFGDASEMTEILQMEPEVKDPLQPEESKIKDGAITFENVAFTHDGIDETLFEKLDLHIRAGEKIGLVGHSGSGKTTLTRLLLRFGDLDSGQILIDGQNIAQLKQDDLRRNIAYVPQEPIMFHRSLMENIRYGQLDASDTQALKASKVAHAHEFIEQLPDKYDTLVGERGVKLSGGQRQRVAIARAMLKNAPILVLDEATSALDSESEVLIQDALWKLMEGRTAIVIAHRLSTIQKMDRIIVMEDGKIVEQGTHKELISKKGIYAGLWAHQSGGFLEE